MIVDTKLGSYEPPDSREVPAGLYEAQILGVRHEMASTGTLFLNVEFEILGPTESGRHVWANFYLTEAARWKLAALLNAVELPLDDQLETDSLIGRKLRIRVKELESPSGTTRSEAVAFLRLLTEPIPF